MKLPVAVLAVALAAAPAGAQTPGPAHPGPTVPAPPSPGPPRATDGLLNALKVAPSAESAAALEAQVRAVWANAASPAVKLLLARGMRELQEGAASDSFDSYDAALDLDPELIEAWRGRASARLHMGDSGGAVRDLQEVIRREPRDFVAWQDLSRIAESRGDWKGALSAWQRLLEVDPRSPGAQDRLKDLRRRALGEDA